MATDGFDVYYNGVYLNSVETKAFDQEMVYDESGTDILYHRFRIRVAGTVHANQAAILSVGVPSSTSTAQAALDQLHRLLSHPRGDFEYRIGGVVVVAAQSNPLNPNLDVDNGPKPQRVSVVAIMGSKAFRVEFEIICALVKCGGQQSPNQTYGAGANAKVLNNRWSATEEKDSEFFTTRTVSGTLRVSHITAWPTSFRGLVVPPLLRQYRRMKMRFTTDPTGLVLKYEITDRQQHAAPPSPAVDWTATYTETASGGAKGFAQMDVVLTGGPSSPKFQMLQAAVQVMFQRIGNLSRTFNTTPGDKPSYSQILQHLAIVEHMHANRVELHARVLHADTEQKFLNARIEKIGDPLTISGYDPEIWPLPKLYDGDSPVSIFAMYLQDPCVDIHGMTTYQQLAPDVVESQEDDQDQGQAELYASPDPFPDDDEQGQNQDHLTGFPYSYAAVENRYVIIGGNVQLPIARFKTTPSGEPTTVTLPIHNGIGQRHVFIHLERAGDWPEMQAPEDELEDPNGIPMHLLDYEVIPEVPEVLPDGQTRLFKMQARIVYALDRPPTKEELLDPGSLPIESTSPSSNFFDGSQKYQTGKLIAGGTSSIGTT